MHPARRVTFRHFLMDDAAACRHPLDIAGRDSAAVAHAIAVLHGSSEHVRDGLNPAVGVPREPRQIVLGNVITEVIEKEKRVEVGCVAESERASQAHARTFQGWLGPDESLNGSKRHCLGSSTESLSWLRALRPKLSTP